MKPATIIKNYPNTHKKVNFVGLGSSIVWYRYFHNKFMNPDYTPTPLTFEDIKEIAKNTKSTVCAVKIFIVIPDLPFLDAIVTSLPLFAVVVFLNASLNKFDFFDSDGLTKSVGSVIAKTAMQITPLLIPGVGQTYGTISALTTLASVLPTLGKAINGIVGDNNSEFGQGLTQLEN